MFITYRLSKKTIKIGPRRVINSGYLIILLHSSPLSQLCYLALFLLLFLVMDNSAQPWNLLTAIITEKKIFKLDLFLPVIALKK